MLFVFFLGFLTSAHENKCLQAFKFSCFCVCVSKSSGNQFASLKSCICNLWSLIEIRSCRKAHTFENLMFFCWKSCNIFLELIHVLKGFLCFLFTPCPHPYSSNLHWPHSQRCARCTQSVCNQLFVSLNSTIESGQSICKEYVFC